MRVDGIYLCRSEREVAIVRHQLIGARPPYVYLVEYARADGVTYAEPSLGKVDKNGYVWDRNQPDPRDLVKFIEFFDINDNGDTTQ